MLAHPLLLAVLVLDLLALVVLGVTVPTAVRVVVGWQPDSSDRGQLRLEARTDSGSVLLRCALGSYLLGTLLLLVALTGVLPEIVPGAMCGTGVLQATAGLGERAVAMRCLGAGLLAAWHLVDRLNRSHRMAPLTVAAARALLLASPVVVLALVDTARALWALDVQSPVDCCAVVYDQVQSPRALAAGAARANPRWLVGCLLGSGLLAAMAGSMLRGARRRGTTIDLAFAAASLVWTMVAAVVLVQVLAPYHYGVLAHHCPWCLFLPEHYGVGYGLFGALAVVALEGPAALLAARLGARRAELAVAARGRQRSAAWRLLVAQAVFWTLGGLPALVWRLRFGTWMG